MELPMTPYSDEVKRTASSRRGFMLVTVLIITAVGLLFGAGALLLFRYQCQQRIDRQHELEKVYAVRSALNYIGKNAQHISLNGTPFSYHTASERDLGLLVRPVRRIFPDFNNQAHLDIRNDGGNDRLFRIAPKQYRSKPDYEYGRSGTTNQLFGIENQYVGVDKVSYGLLFPCDKAQRGAKWWVNIGMPGTGGWLQEQYGRRYFFEPRNYVEGRTATNDVMRLCIIRDVTNRLNKAGCRHGWPLSQEGERAIVLEFRPLAGTGVGDGANVVITLSEYLCSGGTSVVVASPIVWNDEIPAITIYVGMQIAGDRITVFRSDKGSDKMLVGWKFYPEVKQLSRGTYDYFADGCTTDSDGQIVEAPDLRAVLEVEASADSRPEDKDDQNTGGNKNDFLTDFRVTPAYQFDVFLEHPIFVTNRATVAQLVMTGSKDRRGNEVLSVRTYDTHGTEHKGFRQDEREHARNGR